MSIDPQIERGGPESSGAAGSAWAQAALGTVVAALGVVMLWQLAGLEVRSTYSRIGPRLFPGLVAVGLLLVGGGIFAGAVRRVGLAPLPRIDAASTLWIAAGLLAMILLIKRVGFVPAAAVLFACAARGFGSRQPIRDLLIGLVLAVSCQLAFNNGLGLDLPWGVLSFLD